MQFQIKRDKLLKSLSIAHNIVERKNTIPILANVLLETKNNILKVVATDTESKTASTAIPFNLACSWSGIPNFL